ncbi:FbpB family small basic protein [Anaerobacillus isosaccharinicus]|uniref:FbpB family small basic protein n=1 Tax=Anaerobacillus isosaccharinicus TaxID=1532552 RepID=A0A7S7LBH2_9BACI|nr:FbpB family small basic protein [Anaerobacillus isosaccharinicus]MBA5588656.1 FbpB family small basic protein [Anaerobacillus isosaccharinicus]QOY37937.1 FbpB family small basic protein [Anaerobacillus isosaccharinicus]
MRRINNKSFEELVEENKKQLLSDPDALKKIEKDLDNKQVDYSKKN